MCDRDVAQYGVYRGRDVCGVTCMSGVRAECPKRCMLCVATGKFLFLPLYGAWDLFDIALI